MGLQRSISHRQMSLGSKPSTDSLQAAGGSGTHELPRLPGAIKRSQTSPQLQAGRIYIGSLSRNIFVSALRPCLWH